MYEFIKSTCIICSTKPALYLFFDMSAQEGGEKFELMTFVLYPKASQMLKKACSLMLFKMYFFTFLL